MLKRFTAEFEWQDTTRYSTGPIIGEIIEVKPALYSSLTQTTEESGSSDLQHETRTWCSLFLTNFLSTVKAFTGLVTAGWGSENYVPITVRRLFEFNGRICPRTRSGWRWLFGGGRRLGILPVRLGSVRSVRSTLCGRRCAVAEHHGTRRGMSRHLDVAVSCRPSTCIQRVVVKTFIDRVT